MGAQRGAMHEVELTEDDEREPQDQDEARRAGGVVPTLRRAVRATAGALRVVGRWVYRVRRWWPTIPALVVVVALVVVGSRLVQERRESDYLASIADNPAVLALVDASVHELWRAEPAGLGTISSWAPIGDALVGASGSDTGGDVVVLDPETGSVRWRVSVAPSPDGQAPLCSGAGAGADGEHPTLLVCEVGVEPVDPASPTIPDDGPEAFGLGNATAVVALDLRTGEQVGAYPLPAHRSLLAFDGGLVTVESADPDGRTRVTRRDPTTGAALWTYESPAPVTTAGEWSDDLLTYLWLTYGLVAGDTLAVLVPDGSAVLLDADGQVVSSLAADPTGAIEGFLYRAVVTSDGRVLVTHGDGEHSVTTDLRSGATYPGLGTGLPAVVDDGSLGPVALAVDGSVVTAVDLESGSTWRNRGVGQWSAEWYVLDGRVVVRGQSTVAAYDGRTGAERWRVPLRRWSELGEVASSPSAGSPTDGRSILAVEPGARAGTRELVAYAVRDGSESWRTSVAPDVARVVGFGARLYGLTDGGGIAALG